MGSVDEEGSVCIVLSVCVVVELCGFVLWIMEWLCDGVVWIVLRRGNRVTVFVLQTLD